MQNEDVSGDQQRIDKWLWCARFYKTRSLASQAISAGHIEINGMKSKPSRNIKCGDMLVIRRDKQTYELRVIQTADRRGPASEAQTLYSETEASISKRMEAQLDLVSNSSETARAGRPSKKDRRQIESFHRKSGDNDF